MIDCKIHLVVALSFMILVVAVAHMKAERPVHTEMTSLDIAEGDSEKMRRLKMWLQRHDSMTDTPEVLRDFWNYRDTTKTEWIDFMAVLTEHDGPIVARHILRHLKGRIIDVGGNRGIFAAELAGLSREAITVWDQPHVIRHGSIDHALVTMLGGDILRDPLPGSFDTAVLKSVLHDFSASDVLKVLSVLDVGGVNRIVIAETMRPIDQQRLEKVYFSHLKPFVNLFRHPDEYMTIMQRLKFKLVHRSSIPNIMYTILLFERAKRDLHASL